MKFGGLLCALGIVAGVAAGASAQTVDRYEDLVREAVREFDAGNFVEARTLFEQAHARQPSARTLRGLGFCSYELKRYVRAVSELEAALVESNKRLTDAQRKEVAAVLQRASRYVGSLQLEVEPASAALFVDGQRVNAGALKLDAGDHVITARAPGYRDAERSVTVLGRQQVAARLQLSRLELSPAHAAQAHGTQSRTAPHAAEGPVDEEPGLLSRWWFWTAVAVVAGGAAVGLALALGGEEDPESRASTDVRLQAP